MKAKIRKIAVIVDETITEQGRDVSPVLRRAAAVAVIDNPFAGRYVENLGELIDIGEELGGLLAERAVAALGVPGDRIESYGKAAAVGENGELEHAAAILHPKLGAPFRKVLGKGAALIPSSKKRGGLGVVLDIPLGHKDAAFVRSHFDGMEVRINDAPARQRDHGGGGRDHRWPAPAARRRPSGLRDQGRGRLALISRPRALPEATGQSREHHHEGCERRFRRSARPAGRPLVAAMAWAMKTATTWPMTIAAVCRLKIRIAPSRVLASDAVTWVPQGRGDSIPHRTDR